MRDFSLRASARLFYKVSLILNSDAEDRLVHLELELVLDLDLAAEAPVVFLLLAFFRKIYKYLVKCKINLQISEKSSTFAAKSCKELVIWTSKY